MATTFSTGQQHQQHGPTFVDAATGVLLLDPSGLDIGGLKTSIGLCGTLRGIVSAAEAGFVAELEGRAGRHEANEALRKKQKVSPAKAKRRSKTSKTTAEQPDLAAALAGGQISEEHADAIADADQAHPDAGATAALLDDAKGQSVEQFRHTAKDWGRNQQGDQGKAEAERQYKARKAWSRIRPEDGMGVTIAELDPENHATFITALAWWVRRLRNKHDKNNSGSKNGSNNGSKNESANGSNNEFGNGLNNGSTSGFGDGPGNGSNHNSKSGSTSGPGGPKPDPVADRALIGSTPEQLLADALVAMASASTNPVGAGSAVATARMLVIANYDILTQTLTGKLPDGTVLSPETVRRLACDAEILPAVFGSDSQLLDLGTGARTASVGQRVALAERDGGCRGCGASAEFCAAHHIIHWAAQGPTDLDNLVLLCSHCHHLVHEGGYTVHKGPDSKYIIVAPKHTEQRQPHTAATEHASSNNQTNQPNDSPSANGTSHANRTPGTNSAPSAQATPTPDANHTPDPSTDAASHANRTPDTNRTPSTDGASQSDATQGTNGDVANRHSKTSGPGGTSQSSRAPDARDANDANDANRSGNASPNCTNDPGRYTSDPGIGRTPRWNGTPGHSRNPTSNSNGDRNTGGRGTNGAQRMTAVPAASRTRDTSDDAKSNGPPGQSAGTPNGTHRPNRPPSPEPGHRRTPESDTDGSQKPAAPPKGPRGRKRNPIVEQCITDARQAIKNTASQPDLFGYAT